MFKRNIFFALLFLQQTIYSEEILVDRVPKYAVHNPGRYHSLINSADFHPSGSFFCVTFTQSDRVVLYKINAIGTPEMVQCLRNPLAKLSKPQHAAFSPDGEKIVVANWKNQTFTVYKRKKGGGFRARPSAIISSPPSLFHHKPHGIAFSPCGNYLAVAYGAADYYKTAIVLFRVIKQGLDLKLVHMLQGTETLPGVPKGITFSPDGNCLLVTFCDINSLIVYNLSENNKRILQVPRQIIQGEESCISRPEDVKIFPNGKYCVLTNSDMDMVTFYPFDKNLNQITQNFPSHILKNPESKLEFPHGIAISPDGKFLLVTEFGKVGMTKEGNIFWNGTKPQSSHFNLYKILE